VPSNRPHKKKHQTKICFWPSTKRHFVFSIVAEYPLFFLLRGWVHFCLYPKMLFLKIKPDQRGEKSFGKISKKKNEHHFSLGFLLGLILMSIRRSAIL
jgi:hypothetical protein